VGSWFEGRYEEAVKEASLTATEMPIEMLRGMPGFDFGLIYPIWTHVRFAKWNEALAEPPVAPGFPYASALWHAARALAHAGRGKLDLAQAERDSMQAYAGMVGADAVEGLNSAPVLLGIARNIVDGTLDAKQGRVDAAVTKLQEAVAAEDGLRYSEPSDWYLPVRHVLGGVLLDAGRFAAAQKVYEADLQRNRENGWALRGLAQSLRGQKKPAKAVEARLAKAWKNADTPVAEATSK
jgi:tetratricopeptide (TPR) repeat protein